MNCQNFHPDSVEGRLLEKIMSNRVEPMRKSYGSIQLLSEQHFSKNHSKARIHWDWVELVKKCPVKMPPIKPASEVSDPIYEPIHDTGLDRKAYPAFHDPRWGQAIVNAEMVASRKYPEAPVSRLGEHRTARHGITVGQATANEVRILAGVTRNREFVPVVTPALRQAWSRLYPLLAARQLRLPDSGPEQH